MNITSSSRSRTMGVDHDGPSDEEASASQPSLKYQSRSPINYYDDYDFPPTMSPPPPPPPKSMYASPPPPPPPPPHSGPKRQYRSSSRYPTTIQVNVPHSRNDSRRRNPKVQDEISESDASESEDYDNDDAGGPGDYNNMDGRVDGDGDDDEEEDDEQEYDDDEYYEEEGYGEDAVGEKSLIEGKYESFNAPSVNNSFLDNSMDESHQRSSSHPIIRDLPINPKKSSQVLVHYHPQLGDTGYESTLIEQTAEPSEHSYARVSRAMNVATRRELDRPPKHIYPTSRGMHARMIDDARVEEEMNYSPKKSRVPFIGSNTFEEGNDEYNNAATRQIRRRVFRVAMERGIRYERRKKLLDADADVGGPSQRVIKESNNSSSSSNGYGNGYQRSTPTPIHSVVHDEDGGDMPLTPGRLTTPKTISDEHSIGQVTSTESLRSYVSQAPPSPPSYPPSYKTLVYNLISANEPDKLVQIDRVMEKYAGREEELIKKLDLRYRRQRIKRNINKSEAEEIMSGGETKQSGKEQKREVPHLPMLNSHTPRRDDEVASMIIQTVVMSPPKKLTFVKVDPPPNKTQNEREHAVQQNQDAGSEGAGDRFDKAESKNEFAQDEIMIQPQKSLGTLTRAISESTKTQLHSNTIGESDEDDNSGMIPITPKLMNNVVDLGNQVENERLQREREEFRNMKNNSGELQDSPIVAEASSPKSETIGGDFLSIPEPYKLSKQLSYGDGISVITMETKSTLQNRMAPFPGGEPDARFSFDDMKRPPSSITVESAGSGSKGEENNAIKPQFTKLQRVIPEIETEKEKAAVAMAALEASMILDNVEERILARQKLREEAEDTSNTNEKKTENHIESVIVVPIQADDEDQRDAAAKKNEEEVEEYFEAEKRAPIKADDELNEIESLFQEARGISLAKNVSHERDDRIEKVRKLECEDVKVIEEKNEESLVKVDPPIIQSIISSFDDDDEQQFDKMTSPREHRTSEIRDSEVQFLAAMDNNEVTRPVQNSTETSSTYGGGGESIVSVLSNYSIAQKAIAEAARAELHRQKELAEYTERRQKHTTSDASSAFTNDNLEEEIARLIAEKESRFQAERAVALMRAQRELEVERKARLEAEAARLKVEEELERLKLKEIHIMNESMSDQHTKSIPVQEAAENVPTVSLDSVVEQVDLKSSDNLSDQFCIGDSDNLSDQVCVDTHSEVKQEITPIEEDSRHSDDNYSDVERLVSDSNSGKVFVDGEVKNLGIECDVLDQEAINNQKFILDERRPRDQSYPEAVEMARIEAEASRRKAEKELERLRGDIFSLDEDETAQVSAVGQDGAEDEREVLVADSKQSEDDVEKFRHGYSIDNECPPKQSDAHHERKHEESESLDDRQLSEGMRSVEPHMASDSLAPNVMSTASLDSEGERALGHGSASVEKDGHEISPKIAMHPSPVITQTDELLLATHDSHHTPFESHGDEEAIIHHVARVTFEGNPSKGQLSFTTGSKVEAHSNQRGPWWLGRCGGRTGWFPASAIVPESEFLASMIGPVSGSDPDASESVEPLTGDDLNAVYDLIRNPSDPLSQNGDVDSDDESGSPAKSRWLDTEIGKSRAPASLSRDHSPPPTRLDPSEMAGLSERLYEPHTNKLHSPKVEEQSPSDTPKQNSDGEIALPPGDIDETRGAENVLCVESGDVSKNDTPDVLQLQTEVSVKSDTTCTMDVPKLGSKKPKPKPEWRATKDPNSGFIYYYHTGTRETTWEKPEGFVPKEIASPKGQVSTVSSKDKHTNRRKGIMGLISKITKGANLSSEKASVKNSSAEVDFRDKEKDNAGQQTQTTEITELKPSAMTEILRNDVLSGDDNFPASDDESEMSRMSEITDTTLFSKHKMKAAVGKWAEKVSDKLNSPPDPAYASLNDDASQPQDDTTADEVGAESNRNSEKLSINQSRDDMIYPTKDYLVSEENAQWRSAIDGATGRTYYYIRGTSTVTWEKPECLCKQVH